MKDYLIEVSRVYCERRLALLTTLRAKIAWDDVDQSDRNCLRQTRQSKQQKYYSPNQKRPTLHNDFFTRPVGLLKAAPQCQTDAAKAFASTNYGQQNRLNRRTQILGNRHELNGDSGAFQRRC